MPYTVVDAANLEGFTFQFSLAAGTSAFVGFAYDVSCSGNVSCIVSNHLGPDGHGWHTAHSRNLLL